MEVNKQAMEVNMKYMKHSMKSMLYTFIPIIVIFGWLMANLSYLPIQPEEEFNVELKFKKSISGEVVLESIEGVEIISESKKEITDGKVDFTFKVEKEGQYLIDFNRDGSKYYKNVLITNGKEYIYPFKRSKGLIDFIYSQNEEYIRNGDIHEIKTSNKAIKPFGMNFSLFGWKPGWLGTYIIFSIIFSLVVRKIIKVY